MKTRVTVTMAAEVHARAKRLARRRRTTVSGLLEDFVKSAPEGISLVDEMLGCAEPSPLASGRDPLLDALRAKYLDRRG